MEYTVIKLDPELGRRIKIRAAEMGVTMKEIVSEAMNAWLSEPELEPMQAEVISQDDAKTRGVRTASRKRASVAAGRTAA